MELTATYSERAGANSELTAQCFELTTACSELTNTNFELTNASSELTKPFLKLTNVFFKLAVANSEVAGAFLNNAVAFSGMTARKSGRKKFGPRLNGGQSQLLKKLSMPVERLQGPLPDVHEFSVDFSTQAPDEPKRMRRKRME